MARTTIRTEDITASEVTTAKMATDPTNASNLSSGSVPLAQLGNVNTSGLEDDVALLGFKVASNGSLAKYNLVDQTVDAFEDTSGVDASASTDEVRDSTGKYYSGAAGTDATGGVITYSGGYTYHSYLTSADFIPPDSKNVVVLMIAGGASGGTHHGGGGGAGAVAYDTSLAVTAQTYALVVGTGGDPGGANSSGGSGGDSTGFGWTLKGGGGGGHYSDVAGNSGGCGGGGGGYSSAGGSATQGSHTTSSGTRTVYYNAGESKTGSNATDGHGGGSTSIAGASTTFSNFSAFGVSGAFAGGGGSGNDNAGTGGTGGGGGAGNGGGSGVNGSAAVDATGSGGGGGGGSSGAGASGGNGWIGIRYTSAVKNDMILISTTTAAQAAPTKGDIVFTYTNGAGSTTLGTDVTAEISADGGSTWTAMTLGSEGSTGSHNIATSHDVTITSTITSPWNMAYRIKTLNQGVSKTTRIQAVSLGWS